MVCIANLDSGFICNKSCVENHIPESKGIKINNKNWKLTKRKYQLYTVFLTFYVFPIVLKVVNFFCVYMATVINIYICAA